MKDNKLRKRSTMYYPKKTILGMLLIIFNLLCSCSNDSPASSTVLLEKARRGSKCSSYIEKIGGVECYRIMHDSSCVHFGHPQNGKFCLDIDYAAEGKHDPLHNPLPVGWKEKKTIKITDLRAISPNLKPDYTVPKGE